MMMAGLVEGKVALVTGAARGQGRSHCLRLAAEGADIVGLDLCGPVTASVGYPPATRADLAETERGVRDVGGRFLACEADVRDLRAVEKAVAEALGQFGRLDVVVANAGIWSFGRGWEITEEQWASVIATNLTGVWHTLRATAPALIDGGRGGSIIITSSESGLKGTPYLAHYAASKHGVVGLMRTFALELAPHLIRVNTVHPTGVNGTAGEDSSMGGVLTDPAFLTATANALPVDLIEPADVSEAVLWLASDASRYVTGIQLPVDAGARLH